MLEAFQDGLREEGEALSIVVVAVDPVTLEVGLIVHEVEIEVIERELVDAAPDIAPGERHVELADMLHLRLVPIRNLRVLRKDDGDMGSCVLECTRERSCDVGQAARLHERHNLGRGEEDVELSSDSHGCSRFLKR